MKMEAIIDVKSQKTRGHPKKIPRNEGLKKTNKFYVIKFGCLSFILETVKKLGKVQ